jgi:hypothetical protein
LIRSFANELISGNKIINLISVMAEDSFIFRDNHTGFHIGSPLPGTSKEERLTYRNDTVMSRREFWFVDWWQNCAFASWFLKRPITHEFLDPIHVDTKLSNATIVAPSEGMSNFCSLADTGETGKESLL